MHDTRTLGAPSKLLTAIFVIISLVACNDPDSVTVFTDNGPATFKVEVAETVREKRRGLMFREELAPDRGMLFIYDPPQKPSFWMKNTHIDLDIVYIGPEGTIVTIRRDVPAHSTEVLPAPQKISAVLEIVGGEAARRGLAPGQKVERRLAGRPTTAK